MILEAKNPATDQYVSVMVDPFNILCQISKDWRSSIGVGSYSPILGGYWMKDIGRPGHSQLVRDRLATREEIVRFDALKNVTELTATFYN